MYLSSMNNIHIIHGIQYLQNIKYYISCNCLSSFALVCCNKAKFHFCTNFPFKSSGILGTLCFTYILKSKFELLGEFLSVLLLTPYFGWNFQQYFPSSD